VYRNYDAVVSMELDDDFWEPEPETAEIRKDPAVEAAKGDIRVLFTEKPNSIAYVKQLQVWFERKYFHWVTGFAIRDLLDEGFLSSDLEFFADPARLSLKFIYKKGNRYRERPKKVIARIVRKYSEPMIARAAGMQAQTLFLAALLKRGFSFKGENTREFGEKKWIETNHDLDFVLERDGMKYGFEVKNRLEYIEREELLLKVRLCKSIGLIPVFVMRASPKTYNNAIINEGGYSWIFESQIYPPGQEQLVTEINSTLRIPAVCSVSIPEGMVHRFEKWHRRKCGM